MGKLKYRLQAVYSNVIVMRRETGEKLVLSRLAEHASSAYKLSNRAKGGLGLRLSSVQYQLERLEKRGFVKSSVGKVVRGRGSEKIYSATPLGLVYLLSLVADRSSSQRGQIAEAIVSGYSSFLPLIFSKWQYFKQAGVADTAWKALAEICAGLREGGLSIFKFPSQAWSTLVQIFVDKIPPALVNPSLLFSQFELAESAWAKSGYSNKMGFNSAVEEALRQTIQTELIERASLHAPLYDSDTLSEDERKRLEEAIIKDPELSIACLNHIWRKRLELLQQAFKTHIDENCLLGMKKELVSHSLPSVSEILKRVEHLQRDHHVPDSAPWYAGQPHLPIGDISHWKPQDLRECPICGKKLR